MKFVDEMDLWSGNLATYDIGRIEAGSIYAWQIVVVLSRDNEHRISCCSATDVEELFACGFEYRLALFVSKYFHAPWTHILLVCSKKCKLRVCYQTEVFRSLNILPLCILQEDTFIEVA
jgi:hypothetical protein